MPDEKHILSIFAIRYLYLFLYALGGSIASGLRICKEPAKDRFPLPSYTFIFVKAYQLAHSHGKYKLWKTGLQHSLSRQDSQDGKSQITTFRSVTTIGIVFLKPQFVACDPRGQFFCFKPGSLFVLARKTATDPRSNRRGKCRAACRKAPRAPGIDFRSARRASRGRPATE